MVDFKLLQKVSAEVEKGVLDFLFQYNPARNLSIADAHAIADTAKSIAFASFEIAGAAHSESKRDIAAENRWNTLWEKAEAMVREFDNAAPAPVKSPFRELLDELRTAVQSSQQDYIPF